MRLAPVLAFVLLSLVASCAQRPVAESPPALRRMEVPGTSLAYVEEGRGAPVVFVHGAGGDWRSFDLLRPYIRERYRYVALSRRYHVPNQWRDTGDAYNIEQHAADVAAFIRGLGAGKVFLVGNSYGGRVAGYAALRNPELIRGLVIGEASLAAPTTPEGRAAVADYVKDLREAGAVARSGDAALATRMTVNAVRGDPAAFDAMPEAQRRIWIENANTMKPMYAGKAPGPITCEQLGKVPFPVLAVQGEKTRESFRHGHQAVLACLPPGAKGAIIEGATHTWASDKPEASARALLAFLDAH